MFTWAQLLEMAQYLNQNELEKPVTIWDENTNLYFTVKYPVKDMIVSQGAEDIADGTPLLCLE